MQRFQPIFLTVFIFLSACFSTSEADIFLPDWMSYDVAKKQVHFKFIAAENANNNGYNYNGYFQGNIILKVPVDWLVSITLTNRDASATHDLILTEPFESDDIPDELTGQFSSIKRAYIAPLFSNENEALNFTAKEGSYWLFCGVKGHGIEGMWVKFEADRNILIPVIQIRK